VREVLQAPSGGARGGHRRADGGVVHRDESLRARFDGTLGGRAGGALALQGLRRSSEERRAEERGAGMLQVDRGRAAARKGSGEVRCEQVWSGAFRADREARRAKRSGRPGKARAWAAPV